MAEGRKKLRPIEAVRVIFDTLESLDADERDRVLSSVLALLGAMPARVARGPAAVAGEQGEAVEHTAGAATGPLRASIPNIRTLNEEKKPRSNREMAALVAYYLAELAPTAVVYVEGVDGALLVSELLPQPFDSPRVHVTCDNGKKQ